MNGITKSAVPIAFEPRFLSQPNIEDISEQLNRKLHRIRQESIDEALFDVVSGF
jgi:hypothetical protein